MNTLHDTQTHCNPRSINDRRLQQYVRPGWRPHKRSQRQLARDIADPIRQHRANGDSRWTQPSEFTPHPETQTLVHQLLLLNEVPSRAETHGACEADALLRFTRVIEQDDPACVECGTPLEVGDLAMILDTHPAGAIWCSSACAETLARVDPGTKGDLLRRVPALSTLEAAAVVLGIIEGRLEEGWTLDQIDWPKYCRDSAVIQVVSQHLAHSAHTTPEVSS